MGYYDFDTDLDNVQYGALKGIYREDSPGVASLEILSSFRGIGIQNFSVYIQSLREWKNDLRTHDGVGSKLSIPIRRGECFIVLLEASSKSLGDL